MMSSERGWIASRGFQVLRYDAGGDRRAQCGFGPFAAIEYALATGRQKSVQKVEGCRNATESLTLSSLSLFKLSKLFL